MEPRPDGVGKCIGVFSGVPRASRCKKRYSMLYKVTTTGDSNVTIVKSILRVYCATRVMSLITVIGVCLFGTCCTDVATTWSAEANSPDGRWLATARTQQWGGPGTAYDATTVYLKQTDSSQPATQVLGFSHQYATMNLGMKWLTPTHLEVTYGPSTRAGDRVSLDFQAIRYNGVEISARNVLGGTTDSGAVKH
jgi:hypothetical protein